MSQFAKIENNIVTEIIVADQDFIDTLSGTWVQTSIAEVGDSESLSSLKKSFVKKNLASIDGTYDSVEKLFYPPKPYTSWTLNETEWKWEAPVSYPADGSNDKEYEWNEETTNWVEVT